MMPKSPYGFSGDIMLYRDREIEAFMAVVPEIGSKIMIGRQPALAMGALLALFLSSSAFAQDALLAPSASERSMIVLAQYDGPPPGGPQGFDGPDQPFDGPDAQELPPPGYGPVRDHSARRRAAVSQGASGGAPVSYHGFRIDLSDGGASRNLTRQIASMEHQIDIVDGVGLSLADLQLFRRFPIRISTSQHGGGHYDGGPVVQMGTLDASDRRPVLLHEFMHVYHHAKLAGGFQNPEIRSFFEDARSRDIYPEGSYMLKNPLEFFAMTASCYLYGTVARPPYNRDTIRTHQPDYYAYLQQLFGPPHGTHSSGSVQSRLMGHGAGVYGRDTPDQQPY